MKFRNRNITALVLICLSIVGFNSCEKHDFIDDLVITGDVGPQAYWEVGSSAVNAGSNLDFSLQYYSKVSDIDYSEVWYSIDETVFQSVSCPWLSTFTYNLSSTKTKTQRISQFIQKYPHSSAVWSDSLRAFTLKSTLPVSGTLSPVSWAQPVNFDSKKMTDYFGANYMQHFKDSLYSLMKYADFKKMYLGMGLLEDFKNYTDSTFDKNSNGYVYHFPKNAEGKTPIPSKIAEMYKDITFEKLIENTSSANYNLEYKRTYSIEANMRVYDKRGVYGTTTQKKIEIN